MTSVVDKKVKYEKNNCFIHTIPLIITISLIITYLFALLVVSINCYYYYTKHWLKKKVNTYYRINIKMNHVKETDIKNHTNFLMT